MIERENIIAAVIEAAGGTITSRVRLQKIIYLLDRLGVKAGFDFDYYHYGPYSREVDNAIVDAKAFGIIEEKLAHRITDGATYSVFKLTRRDGLDNQIESLSKLNRKRIKSIIEKLSKTNVTILELAATIDWLHSIERVDDWKIEIVKRKGAKTQRGRLDEAFLLLQQIKLAPAT